MCIRDSVYIAESPLYEINCKEKTYFAYTELEKNDILTEIGDQKCSCLLYTSRCV